MEKSRARMSPQPGIIRHLNNTACSTIINTVNRKIWICISGCKCVFFYFLIFSFKVSSAMNIMQVYSPSLTSLNWSKAVSGSETSDILIWVFQRAQLSLCHLNCYTDFSQTEVVADNRYEQWVLRSHLSWANHHSFVSVGQIHKILRRI